MILKIKEEEESWAISFSLFFSHLSLIIVNNVKEKSVSVCDREKIFFCIWELQQKIMSAPTQRLFLKQTINLTPRYM